MFLATTLTLLAVLSPASDADAWLQFIHPLDRPGAVAGTPSTLPGYTYEQCTALGGAYAIPGCIAGTPPEQCQGRCYLPSSTPTPPTCAPGQQLVRPYCSPELPLDRCATYCQTIPTPTPAPIAVTTGTTVHVADQQTFFQQIAQITKDGTSKVYVFFVNLTK